MHCLGLHAVVQPSCLGVTMKLRHCSFQIMWHCANRSPERSVDDAVKQSKEAKDLHVRCFKHYFL
jgi:hypothetical protein